MENSTKPFPLVTGPIYFFDQMKPKIKKWEKREQDRQDSLISLPSHRKSTKYEVGEEARESVVTTAEDEDDSYAYSHILSVSRMSGSLKITKTCQQGYLFKEHKLMAAELLRDLGEMFQTYADYNFTFPVGVANLVSYSWYDLTEGSTVAAVRKSTLKIKDAMKRDYNSISLVSCNTRVTAGESYSEENYLMKVKSDSLSTSSKPMEKAFLVGQSQQSQNSHSIGVPVVIHFSLSSKKCLENGWISQNPSPPVDILMWKTTLNTAVKKLQVALSQIKEEEERLKKKGFNKQLILNHYTDTEVTVKERCNPQMTPCFWLELLKRKPQMPTVKTDSADVKKFHYALLDGSSLTYQVISMMFNQDGGIVISRTGNILREWMWPLKGKLKDPVEVTVNKYITVEVSGRFAITLTYIAYAKVVKLSLAPVKCKSCCPCLPESLFRDASAISREAKELYKIYKIKCKQMKPIAREKHRPSLSDPVDVASFDPVMDISIMYDIKTVITIRKLQRKVKHILLHWLDHYRLAVGLQSLHVCGIPRFLQDVAKKEVPSAEFPLPQSATEKDESREYLRYRYTFLKLKGIYRLSPLHYIQKTTVSKKFPRNPLPVLGMDAVQLACPVVLRRALRGKEGDECRCSASSIPEVTDLEYDYLIGNQLTSLDQIIIVYVFAAKEKDNCMREVVKLYRELNRSRRMPCFESRLDSFRLLKYSIISASKFTGGKSPLLVERHNVVPGIFLMYIQGKLLFANFIFNGYSTSAKDLQKQVEKTRNDFLMGYFLPSDFRIQ